MIDLDGGILRISNGEKKFAPEAAEIWAAVFDGNATIRDIPVEKADLAALGLEFESSTALPEIHITATQGDGVPILGCQSFGAFAGTSAPISTHAGRALDYVILDGTWYPLPFGSSDEIAQFLSRFELGPAGEITFGKYMELVACRDAPVPIVDSASEALVAVDVADHAISPLPVAFRGRLFPYQQSGYGWLSFMATQGIGCILADEMGLGKTVQVVCTVMRLRELGQPAALIVAPATLLENWRREFGKFTPSATVLIHRGSRRAGLANDMAGYDVVVTSFETAVSDISLLTDMTWSAVIVDEAQGIKNPDAKRTGALKRLPRSFAIAVTGTPVENSLRDLWSVTDFVAPNLLGTLNQFEKDHPDTIQGALDIEPRVTPIVLRRRVRDVAKDLPERIDIPVALEMSATSAGEYERLRQEAHQKYGRSGGLVALGILRQFCAHPWMADCFSEDDAAVCSPKLTRTLEILEEILACGEKAIIFAAFQEAVDLVAAQISNRLGVRSTVIDGRTPVPARQVLVDEFGAYSGTATLVMIPKATGVGLNITAANHVIHYTPEWNPAIEDQASARAHRRGQDKVVRIHRLFYSGTVEEVMSDRMEMKRGLADAAVIGGDGSSVDTADLMRAMTITPQLIP